jgi:D-glycero-alpha-D-manno-heptose-7-phosphate kinase
MSFILASAPMRVSLMGGGSDLPVFQKTGRLGMVVSFAISYRVSVIINERFDNQWIIQYSDIERVNSVDAIRHNIIREAIKYYGLDRPLEIHVISDIGTIGTGLGGSSSLTCALVRALRKYKGMNYSAKGIFHDAKEIEISRVKAPIGVQDFIPAAYGGFNLITIKDGECQGRRKVINWRWHWLIENHCVLVSEHINNQHRFHYIDQNISGKMDIEGMEENVVLVSKRANSLFDSLREINLDEIIEIIRESHILKEKNKINRSTPDQMTFMTKMEQCGALAYRRCGAGNHGFYLVCVEDKDAFRKQMIGHNVLDLMIEGWGARIEYSRCC